MAIMMWNSYLALKGCLKWDFLIEYMVTQLYKMSPSLTRTPPFNISKDIEMNPNLPSFHISNVTLFTNVYKHMEGLEWRRKRSLGLRNVKKHDAYLLSRIFIVVEWEPIDH